MEEICRVCLGNHDNMVNIFEGNQFLGPSIPDMIAEWSGYQVTKGDNLPDCICLSCLEDAENAFDIQRTAKRGHQFLCQVKKVEKTEEDTLEKHYRQVSGRESEESSSSHMLNSTEVIIKEPQLYEERTRQKLHDEQSNGPVHSYLFEDEDGISVSETDQVNCLNKEGAAKLITRSGDDNMNSSNDQHNLKCPYCSKTFQRRWNLTVHIRTHSGERPYKCTQCPKSFSRTCGLRSHMSTHTTDRAYKCDYCLRSFRFKGSYSRHMRTQHTEAFQKRVRPAKQSAPTVQRTMEDICRVCMGSHDDMINIFEVTPELGPSIPDMIAHWSGYQVAKGDSLPEHICPCCLEDAQNAFDIRQTFKIGHQFLGHQCQVKVEAAEEYSQYNVFCEVSNSASDKSNSSQKLDCPDSLNENDSDSIAERPVQQLHQPQKIGETDQLDGYVEDDENSEISVGEYFPSDSNIREANRSASDQSNCHIQEDCSFGNHLRADAQADKDSQSEHKQHIGTFQETRKLQDQKRASSKYLQSSGHKFTCTYCPKICSHQSDLEKHMCVHKGERPYKCNHCPKAFKKSQNLKRHIETHATTRKFNCNLCDSTFFSHTDFDLHMQEHEGIMPFKCHICPKSFKYSSSLKEHTRTHTGERPYSCSQCSKAYRRSIDLKRHIWTHDQDAEKNALSEGGVVRDFREFECTLCNKRFGTKYSLEVHDRIHSGVEPYRCDICGKSFKYASSMKVHTRIHTGERPFVCDYCSKAFAQQIDLCRHIRIHTGERPHKCNQCQSTFIDHSGLKAHLLVHTEERPYKCSQCQKAFKLLSVLSRHMRTHTGEKLYKCDHCTKAYADRRSLRLHLPIHSGN